MRNCKNCNKDISDLHYNKLYCSDECLKEYNDKLKVEKSILKYKDVEGIPTCKICGLKGLNLTHHINQCHKINVHEYYKKFNCDKSDVFHNTYLKKMGKSGKDNVSYNHGGKFSPFSKNFVKYEGLTDDEIENEIKHIKDKVAKTKEENPHKRGNINIEYWIHKGYSEKEAKIKLKERQTTFSKEICIEKHGEEKGLQIWKERQEKWQNTLKSKPKEEIERINNAKRFKSSFSKVSQELFWMLYKHIKNDFKEIYFAQLDNNKELDLTGKNHEYMILFEDRSIAYPDFFIKDKGLVIEFDGDYWHNLSEMKERDIERSNKIIENGYKLLHVKECDWKADEIKVIENCKEFIYNETA